MSVGARRRRRRASSGLARNGRELARLAPSTTLDVFQVFWYVPGVGFIDTREDRNMRLTMTVGQRDGLLAAGIIRSWGVQWTDSCYVLAPGMTWDDVRAVGVIVELDDEQVAP